MDKTEKRSLFKIKLLPKYIYTQDRAKNRNFELPVLPQVNQTLRAAGGKMSLSTIDH